MIPKNVKNSDFLSILYSKPLRECRKPKFEIGDRIASRNMTDPSGMIISHSLQKKSFQSCRNFFQKTSNIHNKGWARRDYPRWTLSERVDQSLVTMESFTIELVSNASAQLFPDNALSSFTNFSPKQLNLESCKFKNILSINVTKSHRGKVYVFGQETIKVVRILPSGTWSLPFQYGYCWSHENSHSRKTQSQRKLYHC